MFYFGVDYYPEHWPEERWPIDAQLMSEAGFNVVRLAEFAWSRLEPVEGRFDFDWLDRAMEIISARGIRVVLGTPTASPPPWLMTKHPEVFRVREDGRSVTFGNRREYCPNQPIYHQYTRRIVTQMAEHYAHHPAVIGWQIDNEFGERCYCPTCAGHFQAWLKAKYSSLEELNRTWGTIFWSHVYNDWTEIPLPLTTGGSPNPGLALDFDRFSSDSYVAYQQMQIDILRQKCPDRFITHNFMGFGYDRINYFDLARDLDLVSWDNYPRSQWHMAAEVDPSRVALAHDAMRGLKRKNFWVMEQQAGPGGWEMISVMPRPGELRLWSYQSIAHGAEAIVFFRWRTARFGTEQYWHGLLDHDGYPSRRYQEIKRMGMELKRLGVQVHGSVVKARMAFLHSYDARFAFQIQPNNPQFSYPEHFHQIYRAFYHHNLPIDVVEPTSDLSDYALVIAPALHLVDESIAANLKQFVTGGGVLVLTQRSGVKDKNNLVINQRLPGLLAELCGVEVEEYDSQAVGMSNAVEFTIPELAGNSSECTRCTQRHSPVTVGILCDVLKLNSATTVACYAREYYAGKPAITINRYGKGLAVYIGAVGDASLYGALSGWLLEVARLEAGLRTVQGVEIGERWLGDKRLLFILNHTGQEQEVILDGSYTDLLDGRSVSDGKISLPPREVALLTAEGREE